MKLAEALQERADLNRRIQQLHQRLSNNAIVQEGESPAEDPAELLAELDGCVQNLESLITRINLTNCRTSVDGVSLTALLARRDALKLKLSAYRDLAYNASQLARRATHTEIKVLSAVSVKDVQAQADALAKDLRQLDNAIQAANWAADLI
ncbi:MAG: DIP1984 family protein [Oscillospiraceae bacterium]|nr:DIP1984 family protein [Oscillospiraceae bacterium]